MCARDEALWDKRLSVPYNTLRSLGFECMLAMSLSFPTNSSFPNQACSKLMAL